MADSPAPDGPGITVTRVFDAPRERVWREWTEPVPFADWFGGAETEVPLSSVSMDVRPGGAWRLTMYPGRGRNEIYWRGEYLEVVESKRLVMSWQWTRGGEPEEEGEESRIEIDLKSIDTETEITFTHARLRTEASRVSHERGWAGALEKLGRLFSTERID